MAENFKISYARDIKYSIPLNQRLKSVLKKGNSREVAKKNIESQKKQTIELINYLIFCFNTINSSINTLAITGTTGLPDQKPQGDGLEDRYKKIIQNIEASIEENAFVNATTSDTLLRDLVPQYNSYFLKFFGELNDDIVKMCNKKYMDLKNKFENKVIKGLVNNPMKTLEEKQKQVENWFNVDSTTKIILKEIQEIEKEIIKKHTEFMKKLPNIAKKKLERKLAEVEQKLNEWDNFFTQGKNPYSDELNSFDKLPKDKKLALACRHLASIIRRRSGILSSNDKKVIADCFGSSHTQRGWGSGQKSADVNVYYYSKVMNDGTDTFKLYGILKKQNIKVELLGVPIANSDKETNAIVFSIMAILTDSGNCPDKSIKDYCNIDINSLY